MNTTILNYHSINNKDVIQYNFYSLSEFLDYILNTPINTDVFNSKNLSSSLDDEYTKKWTKTNSFEEAVNYCKFGYYKDFEKFYNDKVMLEPYITFDGVGLKVANDYIGYCPDVKAYLEGNPLNMVNHIQKPKSCVNIYYCIGMSGADNEKVIHNRGVIILNIIESLEMMGHQVTLNLFSLSKALYCRDNEYLYVNFLLKKTSDRINPQLFYYPMCHPSFNRRLLFRLKEVTPKIPYGFKDGYGAACSLDEMQEILELTDKDIIIGWSADMDVYGENLLDDAEGLLKTLNERNKQKTLKFPTIKR